METEDRRGRRAQLRDVLRAEGKPGPLARRAVRADVLLAVVLTVVALVVAARYPVGGLIRYKDTVYPPPVPLPPGDFRPRGVIGADGQERSWTVWPTIVLSALPLMYRRRYPLTVFAVVLGATLVMVDDATWMNVVTCVLGAYSAVMYSRHRTGAAAGLALAAVLAGLAFKDTEPILPGWTSPAVVLLIGGVLAGLMRFWQRQLVASRDRYTELEQAQQEAMRRAVAEERSRIAAELHDVVTHNVSVMVIQAGAARKVMDAAPEKSKAALLAVESGGRAAMAELRHVMGLLAAPDHERPDGFAPQPGLGQLGSLVERVRGAGTPVHLAVTLPPDPLPPGVDLAAYRVVQEALTNTIKHAPGAESSVVIGYAEDCLEIEVTDTGGVRDAVPAGGGGRGLIGLRERLAVYQGELTAGPTLVGGYRIRARIPWQAA